MILHDHPYNRQELPIMLFATEHLMAGENHMQSEKDSYDVHHNEPIHYFPESKDKHVAVDDRFDHDRPDYSFPY